MRLAARLRLPLVCVMCLSHGARSAPATNSCAPGWTGRQLAPSAATTGWTVERDSGSVASISAIADQQGPLLRMSWNLGSGSWVQAKYEFTAPLDLAGADILGLSWRGNADALPNTLTLMVADADGVFFGVDLGARSQGVNQVNRWVINATVPKAAFYYFWGGASSPSGIDWTRVRECYVVLKRPGPNLGGGSGSLDFRGLQWDRAADWPRETGFTSIDTQSARIQSAATAAIGYLLSQQAPTGLFVSWREEPSPKAWLYDQALVLIALAREGIWRNGSATNAEARAAGLLAQFLVAHQKADGHWARAWAPVTANELADDGWIGDQAWCATALSEYAYRSGNVPARGAASRAAAWLAAKIDSDGGIQGFPSTEGTVDTWWALVATARFADAQRIERYLLDASTVWDAEAGYWWRGARDPLVAIDCATWLSAFARHPLVGEPGRGASALSFVHRTLITTSDDGSLCGLDGQGPVSIWNEGTAQYVAAGGPDSAVFLDTLLSQQSADGSMPGSPDNWSTDAFGWLTPWHGLAPTAWLYFAIRGAPFPDANRDTDGDSAPDWQEFIAGTDPLDPKSRFSTDQFSYDASNGELHISWEGVTNRVYTVMAADVPQGPWHPTSTFSQVPGNGARLRFSASVSAATNATYYQVFCARTKP